MTLFLGWTDRYLCSVLCRMFYRTGGPCRKRIRPHFPECAGVDAAGLIQPARSSREGSVQNLSHFRLAERHPALAHAMMAPLICWSFSNSMFRYLLVDHAVPAMWRSLAAARLSAD